MKPLVYKGLRKECVQPYDEHEEYAVKAWYKNYMKRRTFIENNE